jgi:hypothetical protein
MCYFLYLASPLTLSEVRSMLPPGLTADLAPSRRAALNQILPSSRTVGQLLVGACSCDLVRARLTNPIEDERELRARYRALGLSRPEIIRALERHRRGPLPRPTAQFGWPEALVGFVAEHARNAGASLYLLEFGLVDGPLLMQEKPSRMRVSEFRGNPAGWLKEGIPILVD